MCNELTDKGGVAATVCEVRSSSFKLSRGLHNAEVSLGACCLLAQSRINIAHGNSKNARITLLYWDYMVIAGRFVDQCVSHSPAHKLDILLSKRFEHGVGSNLLQYHRSSSSHEPARIERSNRNSASSLFTSHAKSKSGPKARQTKVLEGWRLEHVPRPHHVSDGCVMETWPATHEQGATVEAFRCGG